MTISIKTARQISEVIDFWDDFLPQSHHLKTRHLLRLEKALLPDIENYYLQIFIKDKLIGLAYLQLFKFNHTHLNFDEQQTIMSKTIKAFLPRQLNFVICGNLFRINYQGFYFINEQHNALIFEALDLFVKQNKKLKPSGIVIKDCKDVFLENKYSGLKYHFFSGDVTMEITNRQYWIKFDDYLKELTKKYFKRAKKIIEAFEGITTKELNAAEILKNAAELEKLYNNVIQKQKVRLGTINASYLYELKLDLKLNFELHTLYAGNVMIGFYTYIFYGNEMETHYIGLDYHFNKTHKTYFNILFLSVQKMIECKYERLELGRTSKEAKANLGAFPKQIYNYLKIKNPFARIVLKYFLKRFNSSENEKKLNRLPFK